MLGDRIFHNRNTSNTSRLVTIMPMFISCILYMIFTKTKVYNKHKYPIDGYKKFKGKRIFGDNKTWIGGISLVIISSTIHVLWGWLVKLFRLDRKSDYYNKKKNKSSYNLWIGLVNGFIYIISELPNSFVKRQLDIPSGKTVKGPKGFIFFIVDQIDSLIGIAIFMKVISGIKWLRSASYIFFGGIVHILTNITLHKLKVRKNI